MADAGKISQVADARAMKAAAGLYHAYFTGLILTLVTRRSAGDAAEWVFRVFRHQHHEKFLSSFDKLGLRGLPDAVACAAYHYLSNSIGGVTVEFMRESDRKAWVNFVPPRWIYPGASICGVPSEVSRAFLRGWYAQNGVSLGNPRLGFVCTAQTTDGQHGLVGLFPRARPGAGARGAPAVPPRRAGAALRSGRGAEAAGRGLAARAPRQGRAQLCHGVHPLRPAAAGRDLRTGGGGPPRPHHRPARRRAALQGDGGAPWSPGRRGPGLRRLHGAARGRRRRCGAMSRKTARPCSCADRVGA